MPIPARLPELLCVNDPKFFLDGLLAHLVNYDSNAVLNLAQKLSLAVLILDSQLNETAITHVPTAAPPYFAVKSENEQALSEIVAVAERSRTDLWLRRPTQGMRAQTTSLIWSRRRRAPRAGSGCGTIRLPRSRTRPCSGTTCI